MNKKISTEERIEKLEQAISLVEEANDLLSEVVFGTKHHEHFEAYDRYGFNQLLSSNLYSSSLNDLLNKLKKGDL